MALAEYHVFCGVTRIVVALELAKCQDCWESCVSRSQVAVGAQRAGPREAKKFKLSVTAVLARSGFREESFDIEQRSSLELSSSGNNTNAASPVNLEAGRYQISPEQRCGGSHFPGETKNPESTFKCLHLSDEIEQRSSLELSSSGNNTTAASPVNAEAWCYQMSPEKRYGGWHFPGRTKNPESPFKYLQVSDRDDLQTDHWVRRSQRKTTALLKEDRMEYLKKCIGDERRESWLEVYEDPVKGRGIKAGRDFLKNEFVCEYKGDVIDMKEAKRRNHNYGQSPDIGSFMFYIVHSGAKVCVDGTRETGSKGRLINHSRRRPNLLATVVISGAAHIVLVAARDIKNGEELLFDYGDRSSRAVRNHPWLKE